MPVSTLHGQVSRAMWTRLYPGKSEDTVPIGHITNGVHVPTWLAPQMFRLYDRHLARDWREHSGEAHIWEGIENVDDGELRETHLALKLRLLEVVRERAVEQAERRGEPPAVQQRLSRVLSPDALTIGFARRFATYKRANLILADIQRLDSMVNDPMRPVQFIFAARLIHTMNLANMCFRRSRSSCTTANSGTSSSYWKITTSTSAASWYGESMSGSIPRGVRLRPRARAGRRWC